jgi:polysaccharide export outer membrane protein
MFRSIGLGLFLILVAGYLTAGPDENPSKELMQYVRDAKKAGLKDDQIEKNALKVGWPAPAVKDAIQSVRNPATAASEPTGGKPAPELNAAKPASVSAPAVEKPEPPVNRPVEPAAVPVAVASTPNPAAPAAPATSTAAPESIPVTKPPVISRGVPDEYRIGEGDVVQVSVWGEAAASVNGAVVRPDGMITIPLIKDVHVAGMTPAEAEKVITDLLSKQIKAADVTIIVNQIHSKKVFMVGGGIKKEGPIPYTYRMTVMQAISEAGGLSDYAKRKKIYVLRNENGRQFKLAFDYDAVLRGERMELNIPLLPGDTLVVPNH